MNSGEIFMKKNISFVAIIYILFLFFIYQGCSEDNPIEPPSTPAENIISPNAKVISDSLYQYYFLEVSNDSSFWSFSKGNPKIEELKQGDFLVSDAGKGILRKINAVQSQTDKIILNTSQAALTDVIQQCAVEFTTPLTVSGINHQINKLDGVSLNKNSEYEFFYEFSDVVIYDEDNNPITTNDQILLNGNIGLSPYLNLGITIQNWQLKTMNLSFTFDENIEISCNVKLPFWDGEKIETFASYELHPITFFVGVLPVVITPELDFDLGVNGEIYASLNIAKVNQNAEFSAGIAYANGIWTPYSNQTYDFSAEPVSFSANADFKAYIGPQLNMLIYGLSGPYARVGLFGKLEIEADPEPKAELFAGIEVTGGVKLEIFDHNIANKELPEIIGLKIKVWEQNSFTGKISGYIKDALTGVPIANSKIVVYKNSQSIDSTYSIADGTYIISVSPFNNYQVIFSKPGYLNADYNNVIVEMFRTTILETVLQIDQTYSGLGNIDGYILDAITGGGIADVILKIRKGINNTTGNVIRSIQTDGNGFYSVLSLNAGNYTIEASLNGYLTTYFTVICLGGTTNSNQNGVLTPLIPIGETRIVLTWGETPNDLDSHLTGPIEGSERFHMYYIYQGEYSPWPSIVKLDRDDVDSYGPETTTLYSQSPGVYRFSVHDFTNRNNFNSTDLSFSGAQVRVYKNSGLIANFVIPQNNTGNLWTVFEMSGPNIIPINTFTNISDPGGVTVPIRIKGELNSFPEK